MKFIVEGVTNSAPADTTLIRLLVRGQKIAKRMFNVRVELSAAVRDTRTTESRLRVGRPRLRDEPDKPVRKPSDNAVVGVLALCCLFFQRG